MGRGAGWTDDGLGRLRSMRADGLSAYKMAQETGWSYSSVKHKLSQLAREEAAPRPPERRVRRVSNDQLDEVREAMYGGAQTSCASVGNELGVSRVQTGSALPSPQMAGEKPVKQVRVQKLGPDTEFFDTNMPGGSWRDSGAN
eukprot:4803515-Amphidinium_carterae.1